jgi:hypothetical protein
MALPGNAVNDLFLACPLCRRGRSRCRQDFGALALAAGRTVVLRILGGSSYDGAQRERRSRCRQDFGALARWLGPTRDAPDPWRIQLRWVVHGVAFQGLPTCV